MVLSLLFRYQFDVTILNMQLEQNSNIKSLDRLVIIFFNIPKSDQVASPADEVKGNNITILVSFTLP